MGRLTSDEVSRSNTKRGFATSLCFLGLDKFSNPLKEILSTLTKNKRKKRKSFFFGRKKNKILSIYIQLNYMGHRQKKRKW